MKKQENEVRKIFIKIRMNTSEVIQVKKNQQQTTERNLSNYIRKVSLQKPVIVKYRNATADDFLKQMLELKKELNAIGNNFNQAVHKLHVLDTIPQIKTWLLVNENLKNSFLKKTDEIKVRMNEIYQLWLLK